MLSGIHRVLEHLGMNFDYWTPDSYNAGVFSKGDGTRGEIIKSLGVKVQLYLPLHPFIEGKEVGDAGNLFQAALTSFTALVKRFINDLYSAGNVEVSRELNLRAPGVKQDMHVVKHEVEAATPQQMGIEHYTTVKESPREEIPWERVGGLEREKKELMQVARGIQTGRYILYGIKPKTGYLIVGESGNGKTYLAKAFAYNAGLSFFELTMSDLRKPIVGTAEAQIAAVHREAFKQPSIIFIDEFDGFATFGGYDHTKAAPLAALRYWMSEASTRDMPLIYIATTTSDKVQLIDAQFLRPGRLTEHLYLSNPDPEERADILRVHVERITAKANGNVRIFDNLDMTQIARQLEGKTRAQVSSTVTGAVEQMVHYHDTHGDARTPITTRDYLQYLEHHILPALSAVPPAE